MARRVVLSPWQMALVQRRLGELGISTCWHDQDFYLEVSDERAAVQLWSVVHQLSAPRTQLVAWLETCWRIPAPTTAEPS
jgi:hypothetical protein